MAFLRGVGKTTPQESLSFNYWIIVVQLLEMGIPYSLLEELSEREISIIVGIKAALKQRETDEHDRQQRIAQTR